jgi:hypothetical protein
VARKAARRSSRKRRRSRPREYSDEERHAAFARAVNNGELSDPKVLTPEQIEEHERMRRASKRLENFLKAPQRVIVVSSPAVTTTAKPTPTPHDSVEAILRFVARQWPGVAPKNITPKKFTTAARKDKQFLREFEQLVGETGAFPSRFQIARALGRRR